VLRFGDAPSHLLRGVGFAGVVNRSAGETLVQTLAVSLKPRAVLYAEASPATGAGVLDTMRAALHCVEQHSTPGSDGALTLWQPVRPPPPPSSGCVLC
jgi:hypothetical protein